MSFLDLLKYLRRWAVRILIRNISKKDSSSIGNIAIVAPHPDDEVLTCAGLIALKTSRDIRVSVIFLTDGEAAHGGCCNTDPKKIAIARRRLAVEAGELLGVKADDMFWLGLSDGRIPRRGKPDFESAVERLAILIKDIRPQEVYAPHFMDCWPDHEAASEVTCEAIKAANSQCGLYYYPVWMWHHLRFRS